MEATYSLKSFRVESDKTVDTSQINRTVFRLQTGAVIKLIAQQTIRGSIYFHCSGSRLETYEPIIRCQPEKSVFIFYNLINNIVWQSVCQIIAGKSFRFRVEQAEPPP